MDIVRGDEAANLAVVSEMTAEASRRGSKLVVFPELWSTGYDLKRAASYATAVDDGIFNSVAELAREYAIDIVGSQLSLLGDGKFGNTAVYFDHTGDNLGTYHKIHLFGDMFEDKYLTGGSGLVIVQTSWGKVGLAICYDLRFPEPFRAYALAGVQAVILVAQWPWPRLAHWRTLLRARAIENQMFIIACNRVGQTRSADFFGHSTILDPCGEAILEAGEQVDLLTATIDLAQLPAIRSRMPVFDDRRPNAYSL
jgi:predicted amidohydrolase